MNVLNQYFDKIYLITSFDTSDRHDYINELINNSGLKCDIVVSPRKELFKDVLIESYSFDNVHLGTIAKKGNQSLVSANESIFMNVKLTNWIQSFCIIEDDLVFDSDYDTNFKHFMQSIPVNWDILNLGYHAHSPKLDGEVYSDVDYRIGTHIMAYKYYVVDIILDKLKMNTLSIDWFLNKNIYKLFRSYAPIEEMFYAGSYREYEIDKNEKYKKFVSKIDGNSRVLDDYCI